MISAVLENRRIRKLSAQILARISYRPSVLLPERFSGLPPCPFGTRFRASPESHPFLVPAGSPAPESFTPSAGFCHSPKNFICHYDLLRTAFQLYHPIIFMSRNLYRFSFLFAEKPEISSNEGSHPHGIASPQAVRPAFFFRKPACFLNDSEMIQFPTMISRISSSVWRIPSRASRPTLSMVFSTPFLTMPSPPTNWWPPCRYI